MGMYQDGCPCSVRERVPEDPKGVQVEWGVADRKFVYCWDELYWLRN